MQFFFIKRPLYSLGRPTINARSPSTTNLSTTGPGSEYSLPPSYRAPHQQPHSIAPFAQPVDSHLTPFTSTTSINQTNQHTALTSPHSNSQTDHLEVNDTAANPTKFSQICEVVAQITSDNSSPSRAPSKDPVTDLDVVEVICVPPTASSTAEMTRKGEMVTIVTISGCTESESSTSEMNVLAHL